MNKQEAFVVIIFLQIVSISIIFFASGELAFIIFLILFFTFDVCVLIFDFIDTRNRQMMKEIHEREIEMVKLLKPQPNQPKTDMQMLKEEIAMYLEKERVQIVNQQRPQLEIKPVEGDYRIIQK
jgi:hypothetical protein